AGVRWKEAAAGGQAGAEELPAEAVGEIGAAERGEDAGEDDAAVADGVDVDADGVGGAWVLAAGSDAQPDRCLEDDEPGGDHEQEREPHHQVEVADGGAE